MMYICPNCSVLYEKPHVVRERTDLDGEGRFYTAVAHRCPSCGYPADLANDGADRCDCGGWKQADRKCCPACMKALRTDYVAFAEKLTAGQEEALYDALDGLGVDELLTKWRKRR